MALNATRGATLSLVIGLILSGCGGSGDTELVAPGAQADGGGDAKVDSDSSTEAGGDSGAKTDKDKDGFDSSVDCDDNNASVHPNAKEICNGIDDNCVGGIDEGVSASYYADKDADGYGSDSSLQKACKAPAGFVEKGGDCDDSKATVHPGAVEACNNIDDDCNGKTDDNTGQTYYLDGDLDGVGVDSLSSNLKACKVPAGYAAVAGDCDDARSTAYPGAKELCNLADDDCDGKIDNGATSTFYVDKDGDGWGVDDAASNVVACTAAPGFAAKAGDCNDKDVTVHPGAVEVEGNGIDEDCSGADLPCAAGAIECNNNEKRECSAQGVWSAPLSCGKSICSQFLGCVVCLPGTASCNGAVSHFCRSDGSGFEDVACDPVMGNACDGATGLCTGPCSDQVIGKSYIGCEFYPTVTQQQDSYNNAPHQFAVAISNTSSVATSVLITRGAATINSSTVAANSLAVINLPWVDALTKGSGPSVMVAGGAYRLRTNNPVTVYQYNPIAATTTNDASLLLPSNAWTGKYRVASREHWGSLAGFYAVVASQNGTIVTLSPSATGKTVQAGGGVSSGGTGTVTLNQGDVLEVMTSAGDLTGTGVTATKPVQVIAGHECTNVPSNVSACDHLEESMFPVETLATEYVVVPPIQTPNALLEKGQIVRVIATEAGTSLTFTPDQPVAKLLANAGDFVEIPTTIAKFVVKANKRILVAQYMVGQSAGFGTSDPAMLLTVSPRQWRKDYLVHAPTSWTANYVDLVASTGTKVTVDGALVPTWAAIGATGFSVAHVALSSSTGGNHKIVGDQGVGVSVYGLVNYGSYWYPGGLDLAELATP